MTIRIKDIKKIKYIKKEKIFFSLTWLRGILAFVVAISLILNRRNTALFIFIFTALVGFFENFASKKYVSANSSNFLSVIDFFMDKLLINLTSIALTIKGVIPIWITIIILLRDMLTISGTLILIYHNVRKEIKTNLLGKATYFFQLLAFIQPIINQSIDWYIMSIALGLTFASGAYALLKSEFRFIKKKTELEDYRMFKLIKFADIFTLVNAAIGLIIIVFSINEVFTYAAILMIAAVIIDYLDGKIARQTKSIYHQNAFGKELDSLADTVSFGVAPAIFGFSLMQLELNASNLSINNLQITFGLIAFTIFLSCGILRLARFNIMNLKGIYQGIPITLNGIIIPIVYFLGIPTKFYPYLFLLLGLLMVSSFKVRKLL